MSRLLLAMHCREAPESLTAARYPRRSCLAHFLPTTGRQRPKFNKPSRAAWAARTIPQSGAESTPSCCAGCQLLRMRRRHCLRWATRRRVDHLCHGATFATVSSAERRRARCDGIPSSACCCPRPVVADNLQGSKESRRYAKHKADRMGRAAGRGAASTLLERPVLHGDKS